MDPRIVAEAKRQCAKLTVEIRRAKVLLSDKNPHDENTIRITRQKIKILEGLLRGETAIAEGRIFTHEEVVRQMAKWLK